MPKSSANYKLYKFDDGSLCFAPNEVEAINEEFRASYEPGSNPVALLKTLGTPDVVDVSATRRHYIVECCACGRSVHVSELFHCQLDRFDSIRNNERVTA